MVRLKGALSEYYPQDSLMFQFHNGSIKSQMYTSHLWQRQQFQFHNGSIKSSLALTTTSISYEFQFHNGSIKSGQ